MRLGTVTIAPHRAQASRQHEKKESIACAVSGLNGLPDYDRKGEETPPGSAGRGKGRGDCEWECEGRKASVTKYRA